MRRTLGWIVILLVSCARLDGIAAPKPKVTPAPPRVEPRCYRTEWQKVEPGKEPSDFRDVLEEGYPFPWLYAGEWEVDAAGCYRLLEPNVRMEEPLSFRRYCGKAFGPNGLLPSRYRVEARGRSLGGARRFNGYGELAIQVYFIDPTHYVEVLQTDQHLRVWLADGAQPGSGDGWHLLANFEHPVTAGRWITFGAVVNIPLRTITPLLDGKALGTVEVPFLRPIPHGLTIRATGNREDWAWLRIEEF